MAETAGQRAGDFAGNGFIVLGGFLAEHELAEIRSLVDSLVGSSPVPCCARPHNTLLELRWNACIVQRIVSSARRREALVASIRADDLKWISGYVSVKDPRSPPLWWHQDWWCWDHPASYRRAAPQVAVLCYLTATDPRNGALRVLPGSHHRGIPIHASLPEAHADAAEHLDVGHVAMRDHPDQRTIAAREGDAVAIDYRLLHGTHGNSSDARRDCIILSFAPSWRRLPAELRGHLMNHPAQPTGTEWSSSTRSQTRWLPRFRGARKDLHVNRVPPPDFRLADEIEPAVERSIVRVVGNE